MDLLAYLKSLDKSEREDFARRCNSSVDYLSQIGYGNRTPKADLAVRIEKESGQGVTCEELLPGVDWAYVRKGALKANLRHAKKPEKVGA